MSDRNEPVNVTEGKKSKGDLGLESDDAAGYTFAGSHLHDVGDDITMRDHDSFLRKQLAAALWEQETSTHR